MDTKVTEQYRNRLLEMRDRLREEVGGTADRVAEETAPPGEIADVPTHPADRDAEGVDRDIALGKIEGQTLNLVNAALDRIEQGSFGRCINCGSGIARERLEAIPYTPYCKSCAERQQQ